MHGPDSPRELETSSEDRALERRIKARFDRIAPPSELRERILADLRVVPPSVSRPHGNRRFVVAAASVVPVVILIAVLIAVPPGRLGETPGAGLASTLIQELHTFSVSGRSLDVAIDDPRALREWFRTRVEFNPPRPPSEIAGLVLKGGRLCHIRNQRVVAYMYEQEGGSVSLYVFDASEKQVSATAAPTSERGYSHTQWQRDGLHFSLVGPVSPRRLESMAESLREAIPS